jgi:uroporphyrinogen-III synthase
LDTIPDGLRAHGIVVDRCVVYDTRPVAPDAHSRAQIACGVDAVLFASPSAVRAFGDAQIAVGSAAIVCIGPTTAAAAAAFAWPNVHVADVHTDAGLVATTTALLTTVSTVT